MSRRAKSLTLTVALGATAIATGVSPANGGRAVEANDKATPKLQLAVGVFPRGEIKGIVSAAQRGQRRRARLAVSLHGLEPGTSYRLVGSRQRCSTRARRSAEADVPFTLNFELVRAMQDVFVTELVGTNGSLRTVKSAQIYEMGSGGRSRVACAPFTQSTTSGTSS